VFHKLAVVYLLFHQSQLAAARQRHGSQAVFTRNRFKIRRNHILEDAYNQMSQLSEDDLRGLVRPMLMFTNHFLPGLRVLVSHPSMKFFRFVWLLLMNLELKRQE